MNKTVNVLYSGTIQLSAGRKSNLTTLSAIISPYLANFINLGKLNTAFLHESVIIFFHFIFQKQFYVINVNSRCSEHPMNLWITLGKTIYIAFIDNVDCPKKILFRWTSICFQIPGYISGILRT